MIDLINSAMGRRSLEKIVIDIPKCNSESIKFFERLDFKTSNETFAKFTLQHPPKSDKKKGDNQNTKHNKDESKENENHNDSDDDENNVETPLENCETYVLDLKQFRI